MLKIVIQRSGVCLALLGFVAGSMASVQRRRLDAVRASERVANHH